MTKVIRLNHSFPNKVHSYALFPIGLYCNKKLQKAKNGAVLEFNTGWKRKQYKLLRKCKISINSPIFTFLVKSIYGRGMSWSLLSERWRAQCVIEGIGRNAFSIDECLMIEVEEEDDRRYRFAAKTDK